MTSLSTLRLIVIQNKPIAAGMHLVLVILEPNVAVRSGVSGLGQHHGDYFVRLFFQKLFSLKLFHFIMN